MSAVAVILAAGRSTRMKSDLPKPLHEVCGWPMLAFLLQATFEAGCAKGIVVVGHQKMRVRDAVARIFSREVQDGRVVFVDQDEPLGTGHAARMAESVLRDLPPETDVVLLAGDLPLVTAGTLLRLRDAHRSAAAAATMGTSVVNDPTGYGRVLRDAAGDFERIVEQLDATEEQRAIREVFPSLYCLRAGDLLDALSGLTNDNHKGEYYLTDVFAILKASGRTVHAVRGVPADEIVAPNTRAELASADRVMQARIQARLLDSGVGIIGPVYVEYGASVAGGTILRPFSVIGRGATIGRGCDVGPLAVVPRGGHVPDGEAVGPAQSVGDRVGVNAIGPAVGGWQG